MKQIILIVALLILFSEAPLRAEGLDYYFSSHITFDPAIPTPEEFLGYPIGSRITEHSRINAYYERLNELSDRTTLLEIGRTHENRKLYVLAASSSENIRNIDRYREAREGVRKGVSQVTPLIAFLGNAVHGNESSSADAALLTAYYFTAARGNDVERQLEEGIWFIDPVRNPDGLERFASWINSNVSLNGHNTSPYDREHTEGWPRGRGNHYWFDLNRDWVNLVHPESRARVALYQKWLPHVQADHHEMGTNSSFFFEPTDPEGNESRFVPQSNYTLNRLFADYYAKALDRIGSFYYTKESYDNKNPNFGSTYPDYNGAVGILFEQGSSRGLQQESENGLVTYPFTIRNQLVTTLATVEAALANREALFNLQQEFFRPATGKEAARAYVVGDSHDRSRLNKFIGLLLAHRLEVYENNADIVIDSLLYERGKSYIIPAGQANSALVGIIFDDKKDYADEVADKLGYGAGFSVVFSSGLSYGETSSARRGNRITEVPDPILTTLQESPYAYLVDYRDSGSQSLLFTLLENNILVKTATKPFSVKTEAGEHDFSYGSLLIPASNQPISSRELHEILRKAGEQAKVEIIPVTTGLNVRGVDLGSSAFSMVEKPKVLVVTGADISSTEAGEVWHLFDQQLRYPLTRVDSDNLARVPLHEYNRIVFVSGSYEFLGERQLEELKYWIRNGGTLITVNRASRWAVNAKLSSEKQIESVDSLTQGEKQQPGSQLREQLPTSVFQTRIDLEHPLAFGLTSPHLPVARENRFFLAHSENSVSFYSDDPLLNGYIPGEQLEKIKGSASISVNRSGRGNVILFVEDPLFRGIWDATTRTFVNAVLFGNSVLNR
ncbi:MAG: M14 family zinc carboxypeptidase [Proteiniphilum sp.]